METVNSSGGAYRVGNKRQRRNLSEASCHLLKRIGNIGREYTHSDFFPCSKNEANLLLCPPNLRT